MAVLTAEGMDFEVTVPVVIVGGGAAGLVAALAAKDQGAEVIVLERDLRATGSTSLSAGLIPAPATRAQQEAGIEDTPEIFATDILAKSHGRTSPQMALLAARTAGPMIDWLAKDHGVAFELVTGFLYPGHSRMRMHGPASRTGADLQAQLLQAVEAAGIDLITGASVEDIFADDSGHIHGIRLLRPDGQAETLGCEALILACGGFVGDPTLVARHIPEIASAASAGHLSNTGDAIRWGQALGAELADMGAYQGHGALAHPHGLLLTWAVLTLGGVLVNLEGNRFSNELQGYSEHGAIVAAQPQHLAWALFDRRGAEEAAAFHDYRELQAMGAVRQAADLEDLARVTALPLSALQAALGALPQQGLDHLGRDWSAHPPLQAPFYAVQVSGALFHTQGGLAISPQAQVLRSDGSTLPNLFAAGGAARGLSGDGNYGYLSGNGLLSATTFGRLAGEHAALLARRSEPA